jgi:hypothetical protein
VILSEKNMLHFAYVFRITPKNEIWQIMLVTHTQNNPRDQIIYNCGFRDLHILSFLVYVSEISALIDLIFPNKTTLVAIGNKKISALLLIELHT